MQALYHAMPQKPTDIWSRGLPDLIHGLFELALNLLKGNIPLPTEQYKKLKCQEKILRLLRTRTQSWGFFLPLPSAAVSILGNLIGLVSKWVNK